MELTHLHNVDDFSWCLNHAIIVFGFKYYAHNIRIMKYELLNHYHDEHLLVPVELIHLLHEYDVLEVLVNFHWIQLDKLGL